MRTVVIIFALATVGFCQAFDDGLYHPEIYGGSLNGKYQSIYNGYQPFYNKALNRHLLTPLVHSVTPVPSPYVPVVQPVVYSTPKPIVYSTPNPVVYSPSSPVVYSTPRPVVYSTPSPVVYSTPSPVVYSSPKAFVYSTPKPIAVAVKSPSAVYYKSADAHASTLRDDRTFDTNNYHYSFETNNGIAAEEQGSVNPSVNGGGTSVRGFYEYIGDDGLKYRVDYVADENGYRASGAHLPKAP